jgi:hypothetical protein
MLISKGKQVCFGIPVSVCLQCSYCSKATFPRSLWLKDEKLIYNSSKIDWALEVVKDNTIKDPIPEWHKLVDQAVTPRTQNRVDSNGVPYPDITLSTHLVSPGVAPVDSVMVRSTVKYKFAKSGYVVEIAVYRRWAGSNTKPEPEVRSGVSMYHPLWDSAMNSIEGTTEVRDWDQDLTQFFNNGEDGTHGIGHFLKEVEFIRSYLSEASTDFFQSLRPEPPRSSS